jgi:hypothetical protein
MATFRRISEIFRQGSHAILVFGLLGVFGCSQSKTMASPAPACDAANCDATLCSAQFRGNTSDSVAFGDDCGTLGVAPDAGAEGAYVLTFHGSGALVTEADIAIYLGATPTLGSFSAQSVSQWSAAGTSNKNPGCEFRAGSAAVPMGSFTLTLTSLDLSSADAANGGSAHGSLNAAMYVHAPPDTDCGAGETESIALAF